jgi:hypothetical protein
MIRGLKDGDFEKLYVYTSPAYREACSEADYLNFMKAVRRAGNPYAEVELEISNVVITGNEATFTQKTKQPGVAPQTTDRTLTYVDGRWLDLNDEPQTFYCLDP